MEFHKNSNPYTTKRNNQNQKEHKAAWKLILPKHECILKRFTLSAASRHCYYTGDGLTFDFPGLLTWDSRDLDQTQQAPPSEGFDLTICKAMEHLPGCAQGHSYQNISIFREEQAHT
jgi:hypothetical protein